MRIKEKKVYSRFYSFITLLILVFGFISCQEESEIDSEFYIPVENSRLYVRIIGHADKPLIINLHGGPGAFSGFDHEFNRKHLEDNYLIAYLDQRGGGKSDVVIDSTSLTMHQFVKDLDDVVEFLQDKFKSKKINLLGSSWGGTLGLLYMIEHQEKITSFACISGKAEGISPIMGLIQHERKLINELMENSEDAKEKERYNEILTKLKEIERSDFDQFYEDLELIKQKLPKELGFDVYWANQKAKDVAVALGKDSAYYARAGYTKKMYNEAMDKFEYVNRVFRNTSAYNHLDIIDEIAVINKPVLVLQGEYDYAIGVEQGKMIYNGLKGVATDKKTLKIIPNASHNLNIEAEELYYNTVKSFFDKYNG